MIYNNHTTNCNNLPINYKNYLQGFNTYKLKCKCKPHWFNQLKRLI